VSLVLPLKIYWLTKFAPNFPANIDTVITEC
jgi:hypothetical protein